MNVDVIALKERPKMAYGVYLASVPWKAVQECQMDKRTQLSPSAFQFCSHIIAEVRVPEYPDLFVRAIDGGDELSESFTHKYRTPRFHRHPAVESISNEILDASEHFLKLNAGHIFPFDFSSDFEKLRMIFEHASKEGECIISALDLGERPNFKCA